MIKNLFIYLFLQNIKKSRKIDPWSCSTPDVQHTPTFHQCVNWLTSPVLAVRSCIVTTPHLVRRSPIHLVIHPPLHQHLSTTRARTPLTTADHMVVMPVQRHMRHGLTEIANATVVSVVSIYTRSIFGNAYIHLKSLP